MINASTPAVKPRPVHQISGPSRELANRLLQVVENVPLTGIERSIKFAPGQFLNERFLLGIAPQHWRPALLASLYSKLSMPVSMQPQFAAALARANFLGLAFEQGPHDCGYKAYVEYPLLVRHSANGTDAAPVLQYQGFKWNPQLPDKFIVTDYQWRPRLDRAGIEQQCQRQLAQTATPMTLTLLLQVLNQAAARRDAREFIFLEVAEPGSNRQSVDLNVYSAGLTVAQFAPQLNAIAEQFGLNSNAVALTLEHDGQQALGHVSVGCDRNGKDFVTIYFDH